MADSLSSRHRNRRASLVVLLAALVCCSCSKKGKPLYPVRGKVFFEGKPAIKALVIFHPLDDPDPNALRPRAEVKEDGSFEVFSYTAGDGAPAGKYAVTVIGRTKPLKSPKPGAQPKKRKGKVKPVTRIPLPARYADLKTSGLRVEVHEGENDLKPFELKDDN
jgi:hypothetical protein